MVTTVTTICCEKDILIDSNLPKAYNKPYSQRMTDYKLYWGIESNNVRV